MTGIGPVAVRQPRVRDREADAADAERIRFSPSILPPYVGVKYYDTSIQKPRHFPYYAEVFDATVELGKSWSRAGA